MVRRLGGTPVGVGETDAGFSGWAVVVAGALGPRTRAVVLSSPSNPSGSVLPRDDLRTLAGLCRDRGIRLILDQAYADFRFTDGPDGTESLPVDGTVVRIGSASKSLALPGWRIGWIAADPEFAARVAAVQGALLNPAATPPQRAMLALPDVSSSYFEDNRRQVWKRMDALAGAVRAAGFEAAVPDGGFYLWIDVQHRLEGATTIEWCVRLAREKGVGLWPGEDFGAPGFVRAALPQRADWRTDVELVARRLAERL
jgi:aspartate/methionine/tyrosine aminotransferase